MMSWQEAYRQKLEESFSADTEPGTAAEGVAAAVHSDDKPISIDIQGLSVTSTLRRRFRMTDRVRDIRQAVKDELDSKFHDGSTLYFHGKAQSDESTLRSIGMNAGSHVVMITAKLRGGMSLLSKPPKYDLPHVFKPASHPDLKVSTSPDDVMFIADELDPRVMAPCGKHRFTGETYYQLMVRMIREDQHSTKLVCPMDGCDVEVPFSFVKKAAMLSSEEVRWFEMHLNHRGTLGKIKECPKCRRKCERPQKLDRMRVSCGFDCPEFCFHCGNPWKTSGDQVCGNSKCVTFQKQLLFKEAPMISLLGGKKCPSVRACPKCMAVIEWRSGCKVFRCSMCSHKFCFLCLRCCEACKQRNHFVKCSAAPRQVFS